MPNIGPMELVVVLVIALLILGPKKLPDVGRSVGRGMREFKEAIAGSGPSEQIQSNHVVAEAQPVAAPVQRAAVVPDEPTS